VARRSAGTQLAAAITVLFLRTVIRPCRFIAIPEPRPRGADEAISAGRHPLPACRIVAVTLPPALESSLLVEAASIWWGLSIAMGTRL
jgi:hypothetical protein